ncbi:MAG TPA: sigma-54 dependent transcriptional regulator [Polyangia bacterium]|jgi:DNA-binding NtrC family response regulator|nr:sigma-54 dependent transcriptional regulator [Polyangia bacterium]
MATVLVVDDEAKLGRLVTEMLELDGHQVHRAEGGRTALIELSAHSFDVVVTDLKMPDGDGMTVLRAARAKELPPDVIMMTAFGTTDDAVAAMKAGAADYLLKPFAMDELRLRVGRLADARQANARGARLVERLTPRLLGESAAMRAVLRVAQQVAATDASVLLLGESGTGKTQIARLIHFQSKRAAAPLIEVHCAALPETLLESELFGHEKGAFTGAQEKKPGHLSAADRGTLFLDEIGEISAATQVKLLRFLQDRSFVPVGSTQARSVDVRIISATNRDLPAAVSAGSFRQDFYYRLNVFAIEVPPLRQRREDILPLCDHILQRHGVPSDKLGQEARQKILRHDWPGNIRELENALERALILAGPDEIGPTLLSLASPLGRAAEDAAGALLTDGFNLDQFERDLLLAALERTRGNKSAAARLLGITRRRLYSRLESLDAHPTGAVDPNENDPSA